MLAFLTERNFLYAGIALCLATITYLSLSQRQKEIVFTRLRLRGRRISSADTPPRSLSPEKGNGTSTPKSSEYVTSFPPSQREVLEELAQTLPTSQRQALGDLKFDEKKFEKSLLEFEEDYRKASDSKYCYSGFSVKEIKALGNFPDYSTLSGVPLPEPYKEFDINKALARPYRPFRWAYHQTMCMFFTPLLRS